MRVQSKNSIDYYILPNKILCSVFGMSPTDQQYSIYGKMFAYFRLILALVSVCSLFVPQIMLVATNWGDLKILTGVGCVILTLGQYIFKLVYLVARREKTYKLYKELRSLWDSTGDPEERQSYETFAYWARICTIIFYTLGTCTMVSFSIQAAIEYSTSDHTDNDTERSRYLPFEVWYGTDLSESNFKIAFICQFLAALNSTAGLWGIETSWMTTILHVSGQFKLINTWISNIGTETNAEPSEHRRNCPPKVEEQLTKCIRHHQRMINVVNEVNNLLTPIVFFQILTSGIEICLSGFVVISHDSSVELLKSMFYLSAVMTQLILWCGPGEILIQRSEAVGQVAYLNVPWYELPPTYRRQLLLVILRSQRHCSITALTFQTLSFHTLTIVFNTAASYFTLLKQMQVT